MRYCGLPSASLHSRWKRRPSMSPLPSGRDRAHFSSGTHIGWSPGILLLFSRFIFCSGWLDGRKSHTYMTPSSPSVANWFWPSFASTNLVSKPHSTSAGSQQMSCTARRWEYSMRLCCTGLSRHTMWSPLFSSVWPGTGASNFGMAVTSSSPCCCCRALCECLEWRALASPSMLISHTTTWPLMRPPTMRCGFVGQNLRHSTSAGASRMNCGFACSLKFHTMHTALSTLRADSKRSCIDCGFMTATATEDFPGRQSMLVICLSRV
mmetsp:Transcript_50256/g.155278  ORF Transcript_50256/g.155278 Transcript_50256/m.155278 type:complete len:265 (+) Transcript_50256:942-1736(+)